jgi:hypothetical protein
MGLNVDFRGYLQIQDYLQITTYWLAPPLTTFAALFVMYLSVKYLKAKGFFRLKREPGRKLLPWLNKILQWVYVVLVVPATFLLSAVLSPWLALYGILVIAVTWAAYLLCNTDENGVFIKNKRLVWLGIRLLPAAYTYAFLLGFQWEP